MSRGLAACQRCRHLKNGDPQLSPAAQRPTRPEKRAPGSAQAGSHRRGFLFTERVYAFSAGSCGGALMPKKGNTGHDEMVVTEAIANPLIAPEQLPLPHQPRTHIDDINKL